jgi:hypothetical protein
MQLLKLITVDYGLKIHVLIRYEFIRYSKAHVVRLHCILYHIYHSLMEISLSWEAANCATTQELPNILRNPKVHYRVHKSPLLVPILSQTDPVHTILFYLSKIHFNIVNPPMFWSS